MKISLWPRSLVGQLVFAVAAMLFVAQAVNFTLLARGQKQQVLAHGGGMAGARIIDVIDRDRRGVVERDERGERDGRDERNERNERSERGERSRERGARYQIFDQKPPRPDGAVAMPDLARYVSGLLAEAEIKGAVVEAWATPSRSRGRASDYSPDYAEGRVAVVTAEVDGRFYVVRSRLPAERSRLQGFLIWQTLILYLLLLVPIMAIAWRAARPLRALTRATRANPALRDTTPLEEAGPSDVRDLIGAFNAYRARIAAMLADKDRMLGALGHDLRTPLASLRVRVEQVEDERLQGKMIASIEEMTAMLADILALARAGAGTEAQERVELAALVGELADDYREQGKDVTVGAVDAASVLARPLLLRRALRNLIDNAVAYGFRARLSVAADGAHVRVIVSDDGPGLTAEQIRALVEPFARGEESRNRATGGAGLGLSIARDVAEGEGGELTLTNREGGGLDAMIMLPRGE